MTAPFDFAAWRAVMGWSLREAEARLRPADGALGPSYSLLKKIEAGDTPCSDKTATLCRAATRRHLAAVEALLAGATPSPSPMEPPMTSRSAVTALTITAFLAGPGGRIARRLGLPADLLATCDSWAALASLAVAHNDRTDGGLWDQAVAIDGTLSAGERAVLHALLPALDFTRLADQLGAGDSWAVLDRASCDHAKAVACCILRRDA